MGHVISGSKSVLRRQNLQRKARIEELEAEVAALQSALDTSERLRGADQRDHARAMRGEIQAHNRIAELERELRHREGHVTDLEVELENAEACIDGYGEQQAATLRELERCQARIQDATDHLSRALQDAKELPETRHSKDVLYELRRAIGVLQSDRAALQSRLEEERERCAQVAERKHGVTGKAIADAIRGLE